MELDETCQWSTCEHRISDKIDVRLCDYHAIRVYRRVADALRILQPEFVAEFFDADPPREATAPHASVVYFIEHGDLIKIGRSSNLKNRMQALSIPATCLLATTPGGPSLESELHLRFAAGRVHGEWFSKTPDLMTYIADLAG